MRRGRDTGRKAGGFDAGLSVALLTGCAQFIADGEQARQGWREARVVQLGTGASIDRSATLDCRKEIAPEGAATGQYAAYQYKSSRPEAGSTSSLLCRTP